MRRPDRQTTGGEGQMSTGAWDEARGWGAGYWERSMVSYGTRLPAPLTFSPGLCRKIIFVRNLLLLF